MLSFISPFHINLLSLAVIFKYRKTANFIYNIIVLDLETPWPKVILVRDSG